MKKAPELRIDWATHEAAKYACKNWHYTGKIPVNKLVKIGAWENEKFIGVVVFGVGAAAPLNKPFGCLRTEVCELVRVALKNHTTPVSRIISIAMKFLLKENPKLKVCVSFADPLQGHHGGIYQAGNWIYTGETNASTEYRWGGSWHGASSNNQKRIKEGRFTKTRKRRGKLRYVMPFDPEIRAKVLPLAKPYPKREDREYAPEAKLVVAPAIQAGEGGPKPTPALQKIKQGNKQACLKKLKS